jgi:hypothetical protein
MSYLVGFVFLSGNPTQVAGIAAKAVAAEMTCLHAYARRFSVGFLTNVPMRVRHPTIQSEIAIPIRLLGERP